MKLPVRPALPNATKDNDAHLTRPSSTYKSGNVVQTTGATSPVTVRIVTASSYLPVSVWFSVTPSRVASRIKAVRKRLFIATQSNTGIKAGITR